MHHAACTMRRAVYSVAAVAEVVGGPRGHAHHRGESTVGLTRYAQVTAENAYAWTAGEVIYGSGSGVGSREEALLLCCAVEVVYPYRI